MTTAQYLKAIARLGLSPSGKRTAALLGVSVRQIQRYATGAQPIAKYVALLIAMYLKHGIPQEQRK